MIRLSRCLAALALALVVFSPARVAAQNERATAVQVAVPDSFPSREGRIVILRHASNAKRDVILLHRDHATPEALVSALATVRDLRRRWPRPPRDQVVTIATYTPHNLDPQLLQIAAERLAELRSQRVSRIGNLGAGRWIEMANLRLVR